MSRLPYKTPQWEPVILRMFAAGSTYREISETTHLSYEAIRDTLLRRGVPLRIRVKTRDVESVILDMAAAGKTNSQIAEATGLCANTVWLFRRKRGIPQNPRARRPYRLQLAEHDVTIRRMISEGSNYAQIARALDAHPDTVRRYCEKIGCTKPEITEEQKETVLDMARSGESWSAICGETGLSLRKAKKVCLAAGLWPKPAFSKYAADPEDSEMWFPPDDAPDYGDSFLLKPEHRARLEEVRRNIQLGVNLSGCRRRQQNNPRRIRLTKGTK